MVRPLARFLQIQASSGIALLAAAVVALIWANSPWAPLYEALRHAPVSFGVGPYAVRAPVEFWINDGLMAIFFFVVGLEIRRELHQGELSEPARAALPVAAAAGGMIAPALIYFSMNGAPPQRNGWGVPMATDIAFAVGVLALLGRRVPAALRVLLLALAIIDDIGAILVIALFYSSGVSLAGLGLAALGVALVLVLQKLGVRRAFVYVAPGAVVWVGMLKAGIHPTIAGVLLGLLTPARPWFGERGFLTRASEAIEDFRNLAGRSGHDAHDLVEPLGRLSEAGREALSPVERLETTLHPWVAYGIMPLFALANAGVTVSGGAGGHGAASLVAGVVLGLVVGKPLGILAASYVLVRLGLSRLPTAVTWSGLAVVGAVGGIGFTMAIFVAGLAFEAPELLAPAKLGVLAASGLSAIVALGLGVLVLPKPAPAAVETPVDEAERSTEK